MLDRAPRLLSRKQAGLIAASSIILFALIGIHVYVLRQAFQLHIDDATETFYNKAFEILDLPNESDKMLNTIYVKADSLIHLRDSLKLAKTEIVSILKSGVENQQKVFEDFFYNEWRARGYTEQFNYAFFINSWTDNESPYDSVVSAVSPVHLFGNVKNSARAFSSQSFFGSGKRSNIVVSLHYELPLVYQTAFRELKVLLISTSLILVGVVSLFVIVITSLTQQQRLTDIKSKMINSITQHFKEPIAVMHLATASLRTELVQRSSDQIEKFSQIIARQNNRLEHMVDDLIENKLNADEAQSSKTWFEVHDLLDECLKEINIEHPSLVIDHRYYPHDIELQSDRSHLKRLLLRLLTPRQGNQVTQRWSLETKIEGGFVLIIIYEASQAHIMEEDLKLFQSTVQVNGGLLQWNIMPKSAQYIITLPMS